MKINTLLEQLMDQINNQKQNNLKQIKLEHEILKFMGDSKAILTAMFIEIKSTLRKKKCLK